MYRYVVMEFVFTDQEDGGRGITYGLTIFPYFFIHKSEVPLRARSLTNEIICYHFRSVLSKAGTTLEGNLRGL